MNWKRCGRVIRIEARITVLAILLLAGGAGAATFTVDDSGGANYTRIQDAINNASNGDTVLVYSGTYYENVNVTKELTMRGIGMPVVDARGSGSAITLSAGNSTLEGFTATNSGSSWADVWAGAGIKVTSNDNIVKGNNASNNQFGISILYSENNTISGNIASNNGNFTTVGNGIYLRGSSNNTLISNNVLNNAYYGIHLWDSVYDLEHTNNNKIYHNNLINNPTQAYDNTGNNSWDSSYPGGGNYWNDYTGIDSNGDGIGDTPYNISGGAQDRYPFIKSNGWLLLPPKGSRVWDANKDMSTTYTWTPMSFYAFYYDVDSDAGNEALQIKISDKTDRTIQRGNLIYSTTSSSVNFKQKNWGNYEVIGFMAKKYFAGYTASTSADITDGKSVSPLSYNQLHEVLMDDNTQKAVYAGSTLTLGDGYVLKVADVGAGRVVMLNLLKDGGTVDTGFVEAGKTYKYAKRVGAASDLPIIAVNVASVFQGTEANAAFIKGIFQISESYISLNSGNRYGIMEITGASASGINMENRDTFSLSQGATIDVMGDIKFIVADSSVLRFAPMAKRSGTYWARGTIVQPDDTNPFEWTPMNFVGFYYNLDEDIGTEKLFLTRSDRNVIKGNLVYTTSPQPVSFKYTNFGKYNVIGFMGDKYFVGYTANSVVSGDREVSVIEAGQLHKILLDDDIRRAVYAGSALTLSDGYSLKIKVIDVTNGNVGLSLLKDGAEVDTAAISAGDMYVYSRNVSNVSDLPIIAVHIESVFTGMDANTTFIRGIFQISENPMRINIGDGHGIMGISSISDNEIKMTNPNSFTLSSGSTIDLMGNLKISVADSSQLRFYPVAYVSAAQIAAPSANGTVISIADRITTFNTTITSPITVENANNLSAATILLTYDPNVVIVQSISTGDLGPLTVSINNTIGRTNLSAFSITGRSGNITLADIVLKAVGAAGGISPLRLSVQTLSDPDGNSITNTTRNGVFTVSELTKGDCNGDSKVDIADALFITQSTVGLRTFDPAQYAAADVSGDAKVDIVDALFIAQATVGLRILQAG